MSHIQTHIGHRTLSAICPRSSQIFWAASPRERSGCLARGWRLREQASERSQCIENDTDHGFREPSESSVLVHLAVVGEELQIGHRDLRQVVIGVVGFLRHSADDRLGRLLGPVVLFRIPFLNVNVALRSSIRTSKSVSSNDTGWELS